MTRTASSEVQAAAELEENAAADQGERFAAVVRLEGSGHRREAVGVADGDSVYNGWWT